MIRTIEIMAGSGAIAAGWLYLVGVAAGTWRLNREWRRDHAR